MGSPLRILHVVVNMNRGGAETLIMNLYRNIDRTKVQFDFLTFKEGAFDAEIVQLGGKVHRLTYITEAGHNRFTHGIKCFLKSNQQYRIIHSHMDKMSGFVLRIAKQTNIPIRIAHSHSTESEGNTLIKMYKWYAGIYVNVCATHLYACSQNAAQWLFRNQFRRASILKNGIEVGRFQFSTPIREAVRSELRIEKNTLVLGHVGRFSKVKNHLFLLNVFKEISKRIPESILILVGDGPLRQNIEERIEELHLKNRVMLLGIREDINRLLQSFDLFIFPSIHEGLPVTLIEAQGAGLPCLISNNVSREVDMELGLVQYLPITDERKWIESIEIIVNEDKKRVSSLKSLETKGYDIRNIAIKTEDEYLALGEEAI